MLLIPYSFSVPEHKAYLKARTISATIFTYFINREYSSFRTVPGVTEGTETAQ